MKRFKRQDGAQDLCTILIFFTVKSLVLLFESKTLPSAFMRHLCVCGVFFVRRRNRRRRNLAAP